MKVDEFSRKPLSPVFRMAILAGVKTAVELLLRSGSDVNAMDAKGRSPLMLAASKGHQDVCRLLLLQGADPTIRDHEGHEALAIARSRGQVGVVALLEDFFAQLPASPSEVDLRQNGNQVQGCPSDASVTGQSDQAEDAPNQEGVEISAAISLSPEDADGNGALDTFGWHEEVEASPPPDDLVCLDSAEALEEVLANHKAIDRDEDWDDVDINLPDLKDLITRRASWTLDDQHWARELILIGLRDGRIRDVWLNDSPEEPEIDDSGEAEMLKANLQRALEELDVRIDDSSISPDILVSTDEYDDDRYGAAASEALSYLRRLQSADADPYICYVKELPKEQLSRADEAQLGAEIEKGMLEALVAATACNAVVLKLHSDANAVLHGEMPMRLMINIFGLENRTDNQRDETAEEGDIDAAEDLTPVARQIPDELADSLNGIMLECVANPVDRTALSTSLFFVDLSQEYLKSLWSLASEQDTSGHTSRRMLISTEI